MKYIKTIEEFNEVIKQEKVLVDFYADWCGPCQMLTPILEEIAEERKDWEIIKVNTDNFLSLARDYKIMSIPALKVFNNGKVVREKIGFLSKSELLEFLDQE